MGSVVQPPTALPQPHTALQQPLYQTVGQKAEPIDTNAHRSITTHHQLRGWL
jgi:hypothetical protein